MVLKVYTNSSDLARLNLLLQEFFKNKKGISSDIFLKFGYKMISVGAKETYGILTSLGNKDPLKGHTCSISLDTLAETMCTDRRTQQRRLKELIGVNLIQIQYKKFMYNTYIINDPLPDSTLERTIRRVLLRKKLGYLLSLANTVGELKGSPEDYKKLQLLNQSPFCAKIIQEKFKDFA